ncbi:MAG: hypothetical protein IH989_07095 [Planctomycetes bacterium]|nr:hypothetical protein [Planctomycetota bacterium]
MFGRRSYLVKRSLVAGLALSLSAGVRAQSDSEPSPTIPDAKAEHPRRKAARDASRPRSRYPRRFDLRPQFYRQGEGYRFGVPAFDRVHDEEIERAYRQGLADGRGSERLEIQAQRGLAAYKGAMLAGHAAFEAGKYGLAARQFLLAATLNQGDPASRLCAAHAQIALKDYAPAARLLHRAFELQPRLVFLPMDIRSAYGVGADFPKHRNALKKAAAREKQNGDLWFLLGYMHYYTDNMTGAARVLAKAAELEPDDPLIAELASLAGMSAPAANSSKRRE